MVCVVRESYIWVERAHLVSIAQSVLTSLRQLSFKDEPSQSVLGFCSWPDGAVWFGSDTVC